jgi:proline iminopeptidase
MNVATLPSWSLDISLAQTGVSSQCAAPACSWKPAATAVSLPWSTCTAALGTSCHEFMRWQAGLLGRDLRLIAFDQRGVLRSDPVAEDEVVTENALVEDCEALRQALGVERWAVLGHSFGGRLALRYANRYPARVTSVLFENPCWDVEATDRYRLPALADLYDSLGESTLARECRDLSARPDMLAEGWRVDLLAGLDARGAYWYLADQGSSKL